MPIVRIENLEATRSKLKKLIKRFQNSKGMVLKHHKLEMDSLHIRVYSDASFASNEYNSSQLGCIIVLADGNNNLYVLSYCSKKQKRIVRSIMAGEVFSFSAAFDQSSTIRHDLRRIFGVKIGMTMYTCCNFGPVTSFVNYKFPSTCVAVHEKLCHAVYVDRST